MVGVIQIYVTVNYIFNSEVFPHVLNATNTSNNAIKTENYEYKLPHIEKGVYFRSKTHSIRNH
jgi:hypothetical protein